MRGPANFAGLADGNHVFAVQAVDSSGVASPAASISWTISQPAAVTPCGLTQTPTATYSHVIVIVFENENASDIIGGAQTPYTTQLANQCAQATQDFAVRRPSLPNYIALTSGSTQGIIDNRLPSYHQIAADNIFHQAETSGMTWRQYSSLMPSNC